MFICETGSIRNTVVRANRELLLLCIFRAVFKSVVKPKRGKCGKMWVNDS